MRGWLQAMWRRLVGPRMVYGWRGADGICLAHTRISSATHIECPQRLHIGDHVFIGHFNFIDASGGLTIDEGVQLTSHCALLTHSSHQALRLAGRKYWGASEPAGYLRRATAIGAYTFIGPHSVVAPGSHIGRGVLVRAFSYVHGEVPDFAIVGGQPAKQIGDTRETDEAWLVANPDCRADYESWARAKTG